MTNPRDDLIALAPCPFCGGEAERIDIPTVGSDPELGGDPNAGGSCISCKRCAASTALHFDRKENLYSSWNDRAASRPAPQQTTSRIGAWLAAALDDPKVCAEMKADIEAWMNAGEPPYLPAPVDREAVAWRVLITKNAKTYNEYTERLPFEPLEGSGVVVRREPEPLYTHPPKSPDMIELLKLAYDNMFDGEAREQVRRKLFE